MVSPDLIYRHIDGSTILEAAWKILESDREIQALLEMSNVNTVKRLLYNDHGPLHAKIVAGSALEIYDILLGSGIQPSSITDGVLDNDEYAKLIVMVAAYLHDIGNAVHRDKHELIGAMISKDILDRILPKILDEDEDLIVKVRSEIMHAIYSTSMNVDPLTIEASIVKVADATDMAEGRARLPYNHGKTDIHAVSALSIKSVEIEPGAIRQLRIRVNMKNPAGLFQIEKVLMPKLNRSLIREYVEILPIVMGDSDIHLDPIYP